MKALEEQVPQDLLNSHSGEPPRSLAARLSKRLSEEHLLARDASSWAVWAWAHGLGLGDEYRNDEARSELVAPSPLPPDPMPVPAPVPAPVPRPNSWLVWAAAAAVLIVGAILAQRTVFKTAPPPHIASVDVPKSVRVGKPYTFVVPSTARGGCRIRRAARRREQRQMGCADERPEGVRHGHVDQGTIQYAFDRSRSLRRTRCSSC
ncbi:MAG: hypothetical protein WDO68_06220 [Gammaproteobacteria bacterium]